MNCQPGDIAVIVACLTNAPHLVGRFIEVLKAPPPVGEFSLPDGQIHCPARPGCWIVRFQHPVNLNAVRGRTNARYAVCADSALRPMRHPGDDARDEMLRPLLVEHSA